jgi:hypothetical protein
MRDEGMRNMMSTRSGRGSRGGIARDITSRITKLTIGRNNDKTIRQRGWRRTMDGLWRIGLYLGVGRNWRFFAEGWQYDPSIGLVFYIQHRSKTILSSVHSM